MVFVQGVAAARDLADLVLLETSVHPSLCSHYCGFPRISRWILLPGRCGTRYFGRKRDNRCWRNGPDIAWWNRYTRYRVAMVTRDFGTAIWGFSGFTEPLYRNAHYIVFWVLGILPVYWDGTSTFSGSQCSRVSRVQNTTVNYVCPRTCSLQSLDMLGRPY